MKKQLSLLFSFIFSVMLFLFLNFSHASAIEYEYQSGKVSREYQNTTVYSFDYAYISKFNENTNYLNGKEIMDGGVVLENTNFYSGPSILLNYDYKWALFGSHDSVLIYKYNETLKTFNIVMKRFDNEKGSFLLDVEGVYKIAYIHSDSVKYIDYVYVSYNLHSFSVSFGNRYDSISPTKEISFDLIIKDGYEITKNEYYYAFGKTNSENDTTLTFSKLEGIFTDTSSNITEINKEIVLALDEKIAGDMYLYIKCIKNIGGDKEYTEIIHTTKKVNIISAIEAHVFIVSNNGEILKDKQYYKQGYTVNISIVFNVPIIVEKLQYSFDRENKIYIKGIPNVEITQINFQHIFNLDDAKATKIYLTQNNSESIMITYNNKELPLKVIEDYDFVVDFDKPVIEKKTDNAGRANKHIVKINVNDDYFDRAIYYVSVCKNVVSNRCVDEFDTNNTNLKILTAPSFDILIDEELGKYDGVVFAIFVKAFDKAGNEETEVFYDEEECILDNVIYEEGVNPILHETLEDRSIIKIENNKELSLAKVTLFIENDEQGILCNLNSESTYYVCSSYYGFTYNFNVKVKIEDLYGNEETFVNKLTYYPKQESDTISVGDYTYKTNLENEEYEYETEIYNTIRNTSNKLHFDSTTINEFKRLLGLLSAPLKDIITNDEVRVVFNDGENEIVLIQNISDSFDLPVSMEIYNLIKDIDKYSMCAISGNTCDLSVYLQYKYTIEEKYDQTRNIRLVVKDQTHKYIVDGFEKNIKVRLKDSFNDFDFKYVNSLNTELQKDQIIENVEITCDGKVVNKINTDKLGKYIINRWFSAGGLESFTLSYEVNIIDDIAPVIKLKSSKDYSMRVGKNIPNIASWVEAVDNYDKDLKIEYSISPDFDANTKGTYVVSIWAVDSSGNKSNIVERKIIVEGEKPSTKTYIILASMAVLSVSIIVVSIILEKKKQKKINS